MMVTAPRPSLADTVARGVDGGVNVVQLRDKEAAEPDLIAIAREIRKATAGRGLLLVNGSAEVAAAVGADGVHLPEEGLSVSEARGLLGGEALVGRSVHSVESAVRAEEEGADYVVAGTIFDSASHPELPGRGLEYLQDVCRAVSVPVVAIGGVAPGNAAECIRAGACGVAVLSRLVDAADPRAAAAEYAQALGLVPPP
jgi:thiamine-phosphate diphosphorylase